MSSSSLAFGRPAPSLSDLPVEILDIILGELNRSGKRSKALGNALRLNKRISSFAVKYLYQDPTSYCIDDRGLQVFDTLRSSAIGKTFYPYHVYPEKLSVGDWLNFPLKAR